jgi:hypothetical protein
MPIAGADGRLNRAQQRGDLSIARLTAFDSSAHVDLPRTQIVLRQFPGPGSTLYSSSQEHSIKA